MAWEQTLAAAKDVGADLTVIGTHDRSGIAHVFLGSVAEKVVRYSPIPCHRDSDRLDADHLHSHG